MFAMMTVIVAPTDEAAQAKLADYRRYADPEGALTLMSGWTGVDFSKFDPDQIVEHVESEAGRTALENITRADPDRRWTVREVAEHVSIGGIGPVIVGSPTTVADQLEAWIDETDLDGFNLAFVVRPETFADVVDFVVPELQRRGRYKTAYTRGTLRENSAAKRVLALSILPRATDGVTKRQTPRLHRERDDSPSPMMEDFDDDVSPEGKGPVARGSRRVRSVQSLGRGDRKFG